MKSELERELSMFALTSKGGAQDVQTTSVHSKRTWLVLTIGAITVASVLGLIWRKATVSTIATEARSSAPAPSAEVDTTNASKRSIPVQQVVPPEVLSTTGVEQKGQFGADDLSERIYLSNRRSIEGVLSLAQSGNLQELEFSAKQAGREFSFADMPTMRDRKHARLLNGQALEANNRGDAAERVYDIQLQAFLADPYDLEVVGNLAIYAVRTGRNLDAQKLAIVALSLPRSAEKTGRTADWATLAAAYANLGDQLNARNALLVTLAIAPDVSKRCYSAVFSVKHTYGNNLRNATEAMFERIRTLGIVAGNECSLPIDWE